jgi:CRISPR/Cas system endoribonuclease Cas6 (RAMP superfamily)
MILTTEHLANIKLARYEFTLRARTDAILPPFLGSTLRGSFGHALKEVACSIPHGDCRRCLLVDRCAYPRIFETSERSHNRLLTKGQQTPRPFVFLPPAPGPPQGLHARDDLLRWRMGVSAGQSLTFGMTLIGDAVAELPYMIYAVGLMAHKGFGAARAQFELENVAVLDAEAKAQHIYSPGMARVLEHQEFQLSLRVLAQYRLAQLATTQVRAVAVGAYSSKTNKPKQDVTLRFLSPTRLRIKGELLETPTFSQLVSSLSLRLAMVAANCGNTSLSYDYKRMVEDAKQARASNSTLRIMLLERYSNRQPGKVNLDGFVGQVTFGHPNITEFLPLLIAGEFLNVGSATAFGLGRYQIQL